MGFRLHKPVTLICPEGNVVLEPGKLHSVKPGITSPKMGGIRLEDNVVVSNAGCEVIGPFEKELV